jgi:hypothetical protein
MRQILISSAIIVSTLAAASASDRYPVKKRYVSQAGEIVVIGQAVQMADFEASRQQPITVRAKVHQKVRPVPGFEKVSLTNPQVSVNERPAGTATDTRSSSRNSLFGPINVNPSDWPSGRKCCRPGQPYFNEEPNS